MKSTRSLVFWVVAAGFVAYLLYATLRTQQVTCEVCMTFRGGSRCATASGPDREAASETAQTAACGPLASGMDETIACGRTAPTRVTCSGE
jgi:hypothetical protein